MVGLKMDLPDAFFEEEIRCGYTVSRERKELWAVELDLLNEFDRVCREHGLKYFSDGGTTLGAARHNGFIPWDDDIDLVMFRADYNRLCEVASEEFHEPYFFQTEHTDRGSMRGHAQLRNSQTTCILMTELETGLTFNQGIFIDIFPVDSVPENGKKRRRFINRILRKRKMAAAFARLSSRYRKCPASLKEYLIRMVHVLLGRARNPLYDSYEKYMQSYSGYSEKIGILCLPVIPDRFILERSWYSSAVMMPFESLLIPVCKDYEEYLNKMYGDWKTPEQVMNLHGGILLDTGRPYTEYIKHNKSAY